jgi:hypothetical protein
MIKMRNIDGGGSGGGCGGDGCRHIEPERSGRTILYDLDIFVIFYCVTLNNQQSYNNYRENYLNALWSIL